MIKEAVLYAYSSVANHQEHICAGLLVWLVLHTFVLHPFLISPLRDVPGPYWNRVLKIPFMKASWGASLVTKIHRWHAEYGDVVILAPTWYPAMETQST